MTDAQETWSALWHSAINEIGESPSNSERTIVPLAAIDTAGLTPDAAPSHVDTATWTKSWSQLSALPERRGFRQIGELGRGGMGVVLLAEQEHLNRQVAIKTIPDDSRTQGRLAALRTEAQIGGRLTHPNVLPVHDVGDDFMVLRRIAGQTLEDILQADFELTEVVEHLIKVADAISYAHDRGVLHRDLKPANIMIGRFGEVQVMDWGLALQLEPALTGGWQSPNISTRLAAAGTPSYLSPEMARADTSAIGLASDVYLLGAILYRMLSGRAPHRAQTPEEAIRLAAENAYAALQPGKNCPQRLLNLQQAAMATDPVGRPNVLQFRQRLIDWLRSVDAEDQAAHSVQAGQAAELKAEKATEIGERYAAFEAAQQSYRQASAYWQECPGALSGLSRVLPRYVDAALQAQDLVLAQSLATGNEALERLVAREQLAERKRQQKARWWRRSFVIVIGLLIVAGAGLVVEAIGVQQRVQLRRVSQAQSLLQQATALGTSESDLVQQVELGFRAIGLQPEDPYALAIARDSVTRYAYWAIEQERWDLAEAQVAHAQWLGDTQGAELVTAQLTAARTAKARARQGLLDERRSRLQFLAQGQYLAFSDDDGLDVQDGRWLERASQFIAGWDGSELKADLVTVASSADPLARAVIAEVYGLRPDLADHEQLLVLAEDPIRVVKDHAWRSLARVATADQLPALLKQLQSWPDVWQAQQTASVFGDRLRPAQWSVARSDEQRYEQAQGAMVAGDYVQAVQDLRAISSPSLDELICTLRLAGWALRDATACSELSTALLQADHTGRWSLVADLRAAELRAPATDSHSDSAQLGQDAHIAWQLYRTRTPGSQATTQPAAALFDQSFRWLSAQLAGDTVEAARAAEQMVVIMHGAPQEAWQIAPGLPDAEAALLQMAISLGITALQNHQYYTESLTLASAQVASQHWPRLTAQAALEARDDQLAQRLTAVLALQFPWDLRLMDIQARALNLARHYQRAQPILLEAVRLSPVDNFLRARLADTARLRGDPEQAFQHWQQAMQSPTMAAPPQGLGWLQLMAEAMVPAAQRMNVDDRYLRQMQRDPQHRSRFLVLLVRRLVERDRHHDALQVLIAAARDGSGFDLRSAVDVWCSSLPSMRQHGWPGMQGAALAAYLVDEALVAAEAQQFRQCDQWLADAALHAPDWQLIEQMQGLGTLLQSQNYSAVIDILEQAVEPGQRLSWYPRLRRTCDRWLAGLRAGTGNAQPIPVQEWSWLDPPRYPLPDCRLHAQDFATFSEWWLEYSPRLPPDVRTLITPEDGFHNYFNNSSRQSWLSPAAPARRKDIAQPIPRAPSTRPPTAPPTELTVPSGDSDHRHAEELQ